MIVAPLGPVAGAYYLDNSRVAVIVGPVGSGKSTASCLRLQRHAYQQAPGPDGVARTRWAIVRNTKQQLKDTTMKTWWQIFPEASYGPYHSTEMSQVWSFRPKGHKYPIHAEFMFRPLDDESDVARLLSLDVTGFYFNELREIDESIIAHAGRRAGRFPPVSDGGATWAGWIGDTNPWDTEHFLHDRLIEHPREDWTLYRQPSGMSPEAENRANLPVGYYEDALKDYSPEDASVYVHAEWGRTRSGKPIYSDYNDTVHCRPFELDPRLPLDIGIDFGRTPAATIGQEFPGGRIQIAHELVTQDMGLVQFAEELSKLLASDLREFAVRSVTGDPSGMARDARDETAFQLLAAAGIKAQPARTNEPSIRIEAVNKAFRTMSGGQPSLLIHPRCKVLRRACIDGYQYLKLRVVGDRYADQPNKNPWSHVAEALQYHLLGLGYGAALVRGQPRGPRPRYTLT